MKAIRKILVAVKNPDARRQPAIDKAIRIAKTIGASIEFFHAIAEPVFLEVQPLTGHTIAELKREALEIRQKRLDKLIAQARKLGVEAEGSVEWDFPPHEAIVRRSVRCRADLIIAECHEGRRLGWLMRLTDWELLRASPVPVLLLKSARPWRRHIVLAAVDPSHAHAKPSRLDSLIVEHAAQLAGALRGSLHVMHANYPQVLGLTLGDPAIDALTLAATYEQQKAKSREDFDLFAKKVKIPRGRRHVIDRDPVTGISTVARKVRAEVVVMGAVSRSGLKRIFIGNTAERVLNSLPCDVLVVKPAHFEKRVAAKSRGMRMIAPQPLMPLPV
ncbi:MAG TPA: universal stress protein [Steroidobacteraceae bacterium]|nr:universal stress protein [Steroidobacteraceae bacterium]